MVQELLPSPPKPASILTAVSLVSGTNHFELELICPQNGTAIPKGSNKKNTHISTPMSKLHGLLVYFEVYDTPVTKTIVRTKDEMVYVG